VAPGNWIRSALGLRGPQVAEDVLPEHLLSDAHADLRNARRFLALLHVVVQVIAQIEQSLLVRNRDGLEIRLPVGELHAMLIEQAECRRAARVVGGDDEVAVGWHRDVPSWCTTRGCSTRSVA
jgi:hypothetical protein